MSENETPETAAAPAPDNGAPPGFQQLPETEKNGLFGRIAAKFHDAIQQSRGGHRNESIEELRRSPVLTADEVALRRSRNAGARRMVIPEGVVIEGSITGASDTEIGGRVEGNVHVDGPLTLHKRAVVTGGVRALSCHADGLVEGTVEVSQNLTVGKTGDLRADALAGRDVEIAGKVNGNVLAPGRLRLLDGAIVNGDVQARVFHMEEGAHLNGFCRMRTPERKEDNLEQKETE